MKILIVGSRDFNNYDMLCEAIKASKLKISEIVSGGGKGLDCLSEQWAKENDVPIKSFNIDWNNLKQPGAIKKKNKWNKWFNANAAKYRDSQMVEYLGKAGGVISIDTGEFGGGFIVKQAKEKGATCYKYDPEDHMTDEEYGYVF